MFIFVTLSSLAELFAPIRSWRIKEPCLTRKPITYSNGRLLSYFQAKTILLNSVLQMDSIIDKFSSSLEPNPKFPTLKLRLMFCNDKKSVLITNISNGLYHLRLLSK